MNQVNPIRVDNHEILVALFESGAEAPWRMPELNAKTERLETCALEEQTGPLLWGSLVSNRE